MDLGTSMLVAASGMRAQSARMRTIAENIANASSTSPVPGGDPYRRKVATITSGFDEELNATTVQAGRSVPDMSAFRTQFDPGNPLADKQGYVKLPNVNSLVEIMDMREAQASYEANVNVLDASKTMMSRTIDLLTK
jgi:flagellar basal-body rod protein FlgC